MALDHLVSNEEWASRCNKDGEFRIAARFWNGGLKLVMDDRTLALSLSDGVASAATPTSAEGVIQLSATNQLWGPLLSKVPPRFQNDIAPLMAMGMVKDGDDTTFSQYYAAIMRSVELLRPAADNRPVSEAGHTPRFDAPVGRYVHLNLEEHDYRIYFEEAGQGIPLIMQHTAGCHGAQYRHLFEMPEITSRFRLIAYDLPYHGKSLPPVGKDWWEEEYLLTGSFVRSVPVALSQALELDRPVFMGCSVGGCLALDLAYHHPDEFRAVISLEGGLNMEQGPDNVLDHLWHPQVSNEFKARLMDSLMSPTAPKAYRKETSQVYAAGWPPVFIGDLNYYHGEYDLRGKAQDIDTGKVAVHIVNGEYDHSGSIELGKQAHETIEGSTWTGMNGLGHFPMSEDPQKFIEYLLPILDQIQQQ